MLLNMVKWLKDILPDNDPYHNRGRVQMRKKGVRNSSACAPEHIRSSPVISITQSLVLFFCSVFGIIVCPCPFSLDSLYCLFFFDLRLLISPLVISRPSFTLVC
jgi:hypothetical protein